MDTTLQETLCQKLLALADDELILAHRNSEWTGHAPILEEDIAFSNIAQDELGHATLWYTLLSELKGENPDTHPDYLVFFRDAPDYRNTQLVELPIGDWAFTIMRQYLFDAFEFVYLKALSQSQYQPLAQIALKIQKEEIYHYRHTSLWLDRLGLGTAESHHRMQNALNDLWPYVQQLFLPLTDENLLVEAQIVPDLTHIWHEWEASVLPALKNCALLVPQSNPVTTLRREHTEHLEALLTEMQIVARKESPDTIW